MFATIEDDIEIISFGVTPSDFQNFLAKAKHIEFRDRYTPILWTEELDKEHTSAPRILIKDGKVIDASKKT